MADQTAPELHRIYAPNADYNGISAGVQFTAGVGETRNPAAVAYFTRSGYGIDEPHPAFGKRETGTEYVPEAPAIVRGPESRDAAVVENAGGPLSDAFLPPTNAGHADPHGPAVVAPGLHAVGPAPIRPGLVHVDDPARQEAEETELAQRVLVDGEPATMVESIGRDGNVSAADDIAERTEAIAGGRTSGGRPALNASKAEWAAYAVSRGMNADEAEDATRTALQERYPD